MNSLSFRCFLVLLLSAICAGSVPSPVLAEEGDPMPSGVIEHVVQKGDNLHLIAGYYYRNPRMWRKIFSLNRATMRGPNFLRPGDILQIKAEPARQWDIPYADFVAEVHR